MYMNKYKYTDVYIYICIYMYIKQFNTHVTSIDGSITFPHA